MSTGAEKVAPKVDAEQAQLGSAEEVRELFVGLGVQLTREKGLQAWLRSRPTRVRMALVLAVFGGLVALQLWFTPSGVEIWASWRSLAVQILLVVAGLWLLLPGVSSTRQRWMLWAGCALLLAPAVMSLGVASLGQTPPRESLVSALGCFLYGALYSGPLALALVLVDRSDRPSLRTLLLRAAILGVVSHLLLVWHCSKDDLLHLLVGHAGLGVGWLGGLLFLRNHQKFTRPVTKET